MISSERSQRIENSIIEGYEIKAKIDKLANDAQDSVDYFIESQLRTDEKYLKDAKINLLDAIAEQQEINDLILRLKFLRHSN